MYFRLYENGEFSFTVEAFKKDGDILISKEDYDKFQELQYKGKQFKVKESAENNIKDPTKNSLFDILEVVDNNHTFGKSDYELLKDEQSMQDDKIITNMLASTEMFEMILNLIPQHTNLMSMSYNKSVELKTKGGDSMVEVYATLIIEGIKKIEDVPAIIRPQVIERLGQLGITVLS